MAPRATGIGLVGSITGIAVLNTVAEPLVGLAGLVAGIIGGGVAMLRGITPDTDLDDATADGDDA